MTTTEKLKRIRARCVELLAIATCTGNAEAAWRSTKDEIDYLIPILHEADDPELSRHWTPLQRHAVNRRRDILAAWPDELFE